MGTDWVISNNVARDNDKISRKEELLSQSRIKNDGLCFDISDEIVVDMNVPFFVTVHRIGHHRNFEPGGGCVGS